MSRVDGSICPLEAPRWPGRDCRRRLRPAFAGCLVVKSSVVHTIRRSLLRLATMTFLLGAMLTMAVALGTSGLSMSGQGHLAQAAPTKPTVQICTSREQCTPEAPLNSPAPVPQILSFGFIAASVAILVDRHRRTKSPKE